MLSPEKQKSKKIVCEIFCSSLFTKKSRNVKIYIREIQNILENIHKISRENTCDQQFENERWNFPPLYNVLIKERTITTTINSSFMKETKENWVMLFVKYWQRGTNTVILKMNGKIKHDQHASPELLAL